MTKKTTITLGKADIEALRTTADILRAIKDEHNDSDERKTLIRIASDLEDLAGGHLGFYFINPSVFIDGITYEED